MITLSIIVEQADTHYQDPEAWIIDNNNNSKPHEMVIMAYSKANIRYLNSLSYDSIAILALHSNNKHLKNSAE